MMPPSPPPMPPPGPPPMQYGGAPTPVPGNLASAGMRIVGGLIDVIIIVVVNGVIDGVLRNTSGLAGLVNLVLDLGYFGYFLSTNGQTIGMMPFGFKVRSVATGQYLTLWMGVLRGFIWLLEAGFTVCLIGAVGWLWMLWDPQRQALHDKVAGSIVTTS